MLKINSADAPSSLTIRQWLIRTTLNILPQGIDKIALVKDIICKALIEPKCYNTIKVKQTAKLGCNTQTNPDHNSTSWLRRLNQ